MHISSAARIETCFFQLSTMIRTYRDTTGFENFSSGMGRGRWLARHSTINRMGHGTCLPTSVAELANTDIGIVARALAHSLTIDARR